MEDVNGRLEFGSEMNCSELVGKIFQFSRSHFLFLFTEENYYTDKLKILLTIKLDA